MATDTSSRNRKWSLKLWRFYRNTVTVTGESLPWRHAMKFTTENSTSPYPVIRPLSVIHREVEELPSYYATRQYICCLQYSTVQIAQQ